MWPDKSALELWNVSCEAIKQHNELLCDSVNCKQHEFRECLRRQNKNPTETRVCLLFQWCCGGHQSSSIILLNNLRMSLTSINPDRRAAARTARGYLEHFQWTTLHWTTNGLEADKLGIGLGKVIQIAMNVCESVIWLPSHAMTWTQTHTTYE
jgi:hypothetical protein